VRGVDGVCVTAATQDW